MQCGWETAPKASLPECCSHGGRRLLACVAYPTGHAFAHAEVSQLGERPAEDLKVLVRPLVSAMQGSECAVLWESQ